MSTRIIQSLLAGGLAALFCAAAGTAAAAVSSAPAETTKTGNPVTAMPIPTHTPPLNPAPAPSAPKTPKAQPSKAAGVSRPQAEKVFFDKDDMQGAKPFLSAIWVRAAQISDQQRKPTVIALHGCGGLYSVIQRDKNLITPRTAAMARELRNAGYNLLLPDSLTPRGKVSVCTESLSQRDAGSAEQARDVQSALRWLAKQDDVDPERIAVLGWDNGGAAVMKFLAARPVRGALPVKAGVAFYPSCAQLDANPRAVYKPNAPLMLLLGEQDDWAPVAACSALAAKADPKMVKLNVYPDSYHEFDAPGMPLHVRLDVPNPQHPGQGVTSGTNPETKALAHRDLFDFLGEALK